MINQYADEKLIFGVEEGSRRQSWYSKIILTLAPQALPQNIEDPRLSNNKLHLSAATQPGIIDR